MARRILHVIWIGLLWYLCTWQTSLAAVTRPVASTGPIDRRGTKNGRPILAMANSPRCLHNGKPVEDGRQVSSPEPCLNCTCTKGVLLCYLQSCMPVLVPSPECYVARVKGHCCPEVFCKVSTQPSTPLGTEEDLVPIENPIRRSDDPVPSKKRTTPAEVESVGLLPVLLKRNHNKASSVAQTTNSPFLEETTTAKSTPPFFQSNHRPGITIRERPHYKRRSTTAVNTRGSTPRPIILRKSPPPRVTISQREPPEEEEDEREKIVYDLRLGASQNSTKPEVGSQSSNGTTSCYVNGYVYSEGMAMLSSSKCEYCYCIRGHQMCVRPKCHLKIDGCEARYHSGFTCCPSHYHCEPEINKSAASTDNPSSQMKPPRPTAFAIHKGNGCMVDGHIFSLGVAVPSRGHCQTCYCTQVGVVCRRLECAPRVDGCEPVVPEGHCCPREYVCGNRGLNTSEGLVSHSTDNYDVTVFSRQTPGKPPKNNKPTAAIGTTTPEDGNSTVIESEEDEQKVTIHLKGTSHLEKVSILPNENLAVLVVTTEETKQENKEQSVVTGVPEIFSKKSKPKTTSSVPTVTTRVYDWISSIKELRSSDATSSTETSSATPVLSIKGKIPSHSTLSVSPTQSSIEQVSEKGDRTPSTSSTVTSGNKEYYYDEDYDYGDYFYDYRRPSDRVPGEKLNNPQRTETFAPFPETDATSFGDRIYQKNRQPGTTVSIHEISVPSTPDEKIVEQETSPDFLEHSTTKQPSSPIRRPPSFGVEHSTTKQPSDPIRPPSFGVEHSTTKQPSDPIRRPPSFGVGHSTTKQTSSPIRRPPSFGVEHSTTKQPSSPIRSPPSFDEKPSKINPSYQNPMETNGDYKNNKTSVVQISVPEQQENEEDTKYSDIPEFTTNFRDAVISQEVQGPSTSGNLDLNDSSSSTTKRQSPPLPQFTADIVPDRIYTTYSDDYQHTERSPIEFSNQKRITTANPQFHQTRDVLFEIPTRNQRPALTKAPGIKRPQITMSYAVSSGITATGGHSVSRIPPSSSGIKTINSVLPQGIAEVLLSLTESTPQSFEQETSPLKSFTSTTPEELGTIDPTDAQEILASPKRIVQTSLAMKDQQSTQVNPTTGIPTLDIKKHEPPNIVFSNHRPSLNKRPVPPIHAVHPQTTVNNHKNFHTSVKQKTTTEPLLEFSNHKPITSTSFRPNLAGETRKPGFFRPISISDTNRNRFSPFKVHRVIPEVTKRENNPKDTDALNSEEETVKTEDLVFGLRTSSRPFDDRKQTESVEGKETPTLRWNDASTNPVTVGFNVIPDIHEMEPETKEAVDDQFELNAPTTIAHITSDKHGLVESTSSSLYTLEEDVRDTTERPLTQNNYTTSASTSASKKRPSVAVTTQGATLTEQREMTTENSPTASTYSVKTESDLVENVFTTEKRSSVKSTTEEVQPTSATVKSTSEVTTTHSSLEFRNNVFASDGNIDNAEVKDHSTTEKPTKATDYHEYSSPSTVTQSSSFTENIDKDSYGSQVQYSNHVKGSATTDAKQPSKFDPSQQSEESQNASSNGNETKHYRAEQIIKHVASSFIDRLIPYGAGHEQRLPHLPPRPSLYEKKTTTPAPQVTSPAEKEIGDVCFVDGRFYKSGEIIVKENPCEICRCFYGHPLCQIQQCPPPPGPACILEYLSGYCCPRVTCGVKLDSLRPPSDVNSIFSVPNDVRPPAITMDNQWRPVESPRPLAPRNTTNNGNQHNEGHSSIPKDQTNLNSGETSETESKEDLPLGGAGFKESSIPKKSEPDISVVTTPYPPEEASDFQPKPVFDPNSMKKPGNEKKDSKGPSAIHDNSSGVRKILNEAVTLPPSKMSVPPQAPVEVNPVLPFFHVRTPPSRSKINQTSPPPPPALDFIIREGIDNLPTELGGNLKVSGCNVYGKYYKINDKVSALSQACSECVCSSEGITCNNIC